MRPRRKYKRIIFSAQFHNRLTFFNVCSSSQHREKEDQDVDVKAEPPKQPVPRRHLRPRKTANGTAAQKKSPAESNKKKNQRKKSSTKACNCKRCKTESKEKFYLQSQHRNVQSFAAYHNIMQPVVDGIDPAKIETQHGYFTEKEYNDLKDTMDMDKLGQAYIKVLETRGTTDADHIVGRLEEIYNSIYTIFPCSHNANQCYSVIRWLVGDWCYGLSEMNYTGGNA